MKIEILRCPDCFSRIQKNSLEDVFCNNCNRVFPYRNGKLVLFSDKNELFSIEDYPDESPQMNNSHLSTLKKYIPSISINKSFDKNLKFIQSIIEPYPHKDYSLLLLGCGLQTEEIKRKYFKNICNILVIGIDIDISHDGHIICDGHELPFQDNVFDFIVTTAVLEHVFDPPIVIKEARRCLKDSGYIYSEIPFMQQVHEGAYDFSRYTLGGHIYLLRDFTVIDKGVVAGPATAFLWSLKYLLDAIFGNRILKILSRLVVTLLFPIKYMDYFIPENRMVDSMSCSFVLARKDNKKLIQKDIIQMYTGTNKINHF